MIGFRWFSHLGRRTHSTFGVDQATRAEICRLWGCRLDTLDIALRLDLSEATVSHVLHDDRSRRRRIVAKVQ